MNMLISNKIIDTIVFHGIMEEFEMITGKKRGSSVDNGIAASDVLK